ITALDAVGPYEVLSRIPEVTVRFVGKTAGPKRTDNKMLALYADFSLEDLRPPQIIIIPGGFGIEGLLVDDEVIAWLKMVHETSVWTCSVCTGALLLGAAGLLNGKKATTHWSSIDDLLKYHAIPMANRRVMVDGKIITSAGVSAGIDMALTFASLICGEEITKAIQLSMEYDPKPPFDSGSHEKASSSTIDLARSGCLRKNNHFSPALL
ncbi:MAG TPA: DJ-1/PfpI family protein, partial [Myxococcota bacterium]|nr:DJ-1/PfpI family protein [Myxococcota bacterium]